MLSTREVTALASLGVMFVSMAFLTIMTLPVVACNLLVDYHCSISNISFEDSILVWEEDITVKYNAEPIRPFESDYISKVIYKPVKISSDERRLLECLVEKEAGTEGLEGKRRVADVVLNRVDSYKFPNSITEVIFSPNQFSTVDSNDLDSIYSSTGTSETIQAVDMELNGDRLDAGSLYFATKPLTQEGLYQYKKHYFSK